MNLSEYASLDGIGLSSLIGCGDISAAEVTEAAIDAIEQLNPTLNAVVMTNYDAGRRTARSITQNDPLSGAPFLLKDVNVFSHDMPTTFSCRFFDGVSPRPDSDSVRRWRAAGLNILGKTNTPEFAEDFVTESTWRGAALNPWNLKLTVGGSSGGAGSAVASGMVPIAHGTDLGGSIRIPAACCGVFGHKPTAGLNPSTPYYAELSSGFNSDHVLTRTVRDSAASLDVTTGVVLGNRYQIPPEVDSYLGVLDRELPSLKIGVCELTPHGRAVDERPRNAVCSTARLLEQTGHEIVEYRFPADLDIGSWAEIVWMLDICYELDRRIAEVGREPEDDELEAFTRYARQRIKCTSAMQYYDARARAHQCSIKIMESMEDLDLLLTPALGSDPIEVGAMDSRTSAFDYDQWCEQGYRFAPFSQVCNITGQPSASLPVWLPGNSLPSAVQLSGHHRKDHILLQVAHFIEQECQWSRHRPPIWAGNL